MMCPTSPKLDVPLDISSTKFVSLVFQYFPWDNNRETSHLSLLFHILPRYDLPVYYHFILLWQWDSSSTEKHLISACYSIFFPDMSSQGSTILVFSGNRILVTNDDSHLFITFGYWHWIFMQPQILIISGIPHCTRSLAVSFLVILTFLVHLYSWYETFNLHFKVSKAAACYSHSIIQIAIAFSTLPQLSLTCYLWFV